MTARAQFMSEKYGLMIHFLPPDLYYPGGSKVTSPEDAANAFDIDNFMRQFDDTGAEWLIFTLGQNTGFYNAPNDVIEHYAGTGHCAERDLVMELADELQKRNKHLILYLPTEICANDSLHAGFGWDSESGRPQNEFQKRWIEVVRFWSKRYAKKISGWWFDGCFHDGFFPCPLMRWDEWFDAARCGNDAGAITFNDGCFITNRIDPVNPKCDYFAGEVAMLLGSKPRIGRGESKNVFHNKSRNMPDSETMAHLLLPIDEQWLFVPEIPGIRWLNEVMPDHPYRREFSTEIGPPIYTDEQLAGVLKDFCGNGGAVTFNIACYADGGAGPATIAQLQRITQIQNELCKTMNLKT